MFETGDRDRMFELMASLKNAMVVADATSIVEWAEAQESADTSSIGVVGYCMSGPFTILVGAAMPDRVKAVASIHRVALATESADSPHMNLAGISAEIYVASAEKGEHITPAEVDKFEEALSASSATGRVEWYPGTEHGFSFAERPVYDQDASERHWERLHDLFARNL